MHGLDDTRGCDLLFSVLYSFFLASLESVISFFGLLWI